MSALDNLKAAVADLGTAVAANLADQSGGATAAELEGVTADVQAITSTIAQTAPAAPLAMDAEVPADEPVA